MGGTQRWTKLDQIKAIAFERLLSEECPNCHTLTEDWKDEWGHYLEEPVYTPVARTCPGCAEIERMREKIPDKSRGAFVTLIPMAYLSEGDDDWLEIAEIRAREAKEAELRKRLGE
jgi:hypothetical protein